MKERLVIYDAVRELREEIDEANMRADEAGARIKVLEAQLAAKS